MDIYVYTESVKFFIHDIEQLDASYACNLFSS